MSTRRVVLIAVVVGLAIVTCGFAGAQSRDHAQPRSGQQAGPQRGQGDRSHRNDGGDPRPQYRPPRQGENPRQYGREAERRHPQPHPNQARPYRYRDYQGPRPDGWYRFPRYYGNRYWQPFSHMYFRGQPFRPHFRGWSYRLNTWFYWSYLDAPACGCGWYWVPTEQYIQDDGGEPGYVYGGWRYIYICVDCRPTPWYP